MSDELKTLKEKEDPLDEIFTRTITLKEYKELENLIDEYRKLYAKAVLVREREFINMLNERQELLDLIFKLNKRLEELKNNHEQDGAYEGEDLK